jgi:hypothetical protein
MGRWALGAALGWLLSAGGVAHAQGYSVVGGEAPRAADAGTTVPATPPPAPTTGQATVAPAEGATATTNGQGTAVITNRGRGGTATVRATRGPGEYGGIVPGREVPAGIARQASRRAGRQEQGRIVVAWPGFQASPRGSRIFLAVTAQPTIVTQHAPGRLVYRLQNAVVPVRNNRRPLETGAFETPVERAYLRQRGRDVELVIELRAPVEPTLTQQADSAGLQYVFLDFPRWTPPDHVPLPVREGIRPAQPAPNGTAPLDEEVPPQVQP